MASAADQTDAIFNFLKERWRKHRLLLITHITLHIRHLVRGSGIVSDHEEVSRYGPRCVFYCLRLAGQPTISPLLHLWN